MVKEGRGHAQTHPLYCRAHAHEEGAQQGPIKLLYLPLIVVEWRDFAPITASRGRWGRVGGRQEGTGELATIGLQDLDLTEKWRDGERREKISNGGEGEWNRSEPLYIEVNIFLGPRDFG